MSTTRQAITDMTMGELSRKLLGRFDLQAYSRGMLEITNAVPFFPGGCTYRPGFRFIGGTKGTGAVRLATFIVSRTVAYLLEIGPNYIRFWRAGNLVGGDVPVEVATAWSSAINERLQFAQIGASLYIASGVGPVKVLTMTALDSFEFADITITGNAGMLPFQGAGEYPRAIAFHDGRLYLAGTDNEPQGIWASVPFDYGNFTYYETIESTSRQYREPYNEFTGAIVAGSNIVSGIDPEEIAGFKKGDRITGTGIVTKPSVNFVATTTIGNKVLTNVSSSVTAQLSIGEAVGGQGIPNTTITAIGANTVTLNNAATASGATQTITRAARDTKITAIGETTITLSIPATATNPAADLVDGWADATVPELETVTTTKNVVTSASAFKKVIAGRMNETILWLAAGADLIVGTTTGERIIPSGTNSVNFTCKPQSAFGSAEIQPVLVNSTMLFMGSGRKNIQEYLYDSGTESYQSPDLNAVADHIFGAGALELDYQSGARPMVWVTTEDGEAAVCAYNRLVEMAAWFHVKHSSGDIESLAIVPEDGADVVYCIVNDGAARSVERLGALFADDPHLDSWSEAIVAEGPAISGVTQLSGAAVAKYNGQAYDIEVAAGAASLPEEIPVGATVQVGRRVQMRLVTMPLIPQGQTREKTVFRASFRLLDSYPFSIGTTEGALELAAFDGPFNGDHTIPCPGIWDKQGSLVVEHEDPFDLTILGIAPDVGVGGY